MSDYFPEEIQLYILKYLPVESLLRSRCVCKLWKQTIDSEAFIQDHLSNQKPRLIIECEEPNFLIGYPSELPPLDILLSPEPGERLHLVGTLHGILCLYDESTNEFLLWNPWTRKSITLKNYSDYYWDEYEPGTQVSQLGHCAGFWIDPRNKEFKIIVFKLYDFEDEEDAYEIYSSSTSAWKVFPVGELQTFHTYEPTASTVIGDVGYWTAFYDYWSDSEEEELQKMKGVVLLGFDFVKEVFLKPIEAPITYAVWNRPVLCNRDGALSLVYMDPAKSCDIYARKEGEWVHVFGEDLQPRVERVLWADAEIGKVVVSTVSGELILYDTEKKFCYCLKTGLEAASDFVIANGFVESLLDPN